MSVTPPFARHCPLILESDVLSLSPGLVVEPTHLWDTAVGARHHISHEGSRLLLQLAATVPYCVLRTTSTGMTNDRQLTELLGFLNAIGGLRRQRTWHGSTKALASHCQSLLVGISHASLTWRRPATPRTVSLGLMRACTLIYMGALGVGGLLLIGGFLTVAQSLAVCLYFALLFSWSLYIHELTHLVIVQQRGAYPAVLQRGMRGGIVRRTLSADTEWRSAIWGPVAGIVACLPAIAGTWLLGLPWVAALGALVACFHLGSWLPWYGDGRTVVRHLRGVTV